MKIIRKLLINTYILVEINRAIQIRLELFHSLSFMNNSHQLNSLLLQLLFQVAQLLGFLATKLATRATDNGQESRRFVQDLRSLKKQLKV